MTVQQTTLGSVISCEGVGLHSGANVKLTLRPAAADTGIVFCRTDVEGDGSVPVRFDNVVDTQLGTTIANAEGVRVLTIEHLMAAIYGCGVDNAIVELTAEEVPIMDGSSAPFVFLIEMVGVEMLDAPRKVLRIARTVRVGDRTKYASFTPCDHFEVDLAIEFETGAIGKQQRHVRLVDGAFKAELSRARTFGFLKDVEMLQSMGLARGGSLDNSIVIDGDDIINEGGLRFDDEFVRHKLLDVVGDLATAGYRIEGKFEGFRTGHALNNELLRAVLSDPANYEIVEDTSDVMPARRVMAAAQ